MFDIAELFGRAYIRAQRADLAINGFRVTGICPLDRSVFQDHDFIDDEPIDSNIDSTARLDLANSDDSTNDNDKINPTAQPAYRPIDAEQAFCEESEVNYEKCHFIVRENTKSNNSLVVGPNKIFQRNTTNSVQNLASLALAATLQCTELQTASLEEELRVKAKSRAIAEVKASEIAIDSHKAKPSKVNSDAVNLFAGPSTSSNYSPTKIIQNFSSSKDDDAIEELAGPSTSTNYVSPIQLRPIPRLQKKSSNRGRKGTKPTFLTSSPYKQDLQASIKRKEDIELLKRKKSFKQELEKQNEQRTIKKPVTKRKLKTKQNKKKTEQKKNYC